ncbi:hypothetical protein MRB53_037881 [Persea americana]|nr:hypothetical protein MRB53_037881 [Persea americana]
MSEGKGSIIFPEGVITIDSIGEWLDRVPCHFDDGHRQTRVSRIRIRKHWMTHLVTLLQTAQAGPSCIAKCRIKAIAPRSQCGNASCASSTILNVSAFGSRSQAAFSRLDAVSPAMCSVHVICDGLRGVPRKKQKISKKAVY